MTFSLLPKYISGWLIAAVGILAVECPTQAGPIHVSYAVSGTSGNYTLDFKVSNGMPTGSDQVVYFFGVSLANGTITGSGGAFGTTTAFGGYNDAWTTSVGTGVFRGSSLNGFSVLDTDAVAPTVVDYFAYTAGNVPYHADINPGFFGSATVAGVPDAGATLGMLGLGLGAVAAFKRSRAS